MRLVMDPSSSATHVAADDTEGTSRAGDPTRSSRWRLCLFAEPCAASAFRCRWSDSHTGALLLHAWLPPSPEGCVRHGWLWATPCIVRASNHPKIRGHRPRGMMRRPHLSGCSAACRCCFLVCLLWLPHSPSLCHGGFGLRNAEHHAVVAYRASWTSWAARRDRASAQALTRFSDGPGPLPDAVAANKLQASTPHVGCCAGPLCCETTTPPTANSAPLHALLTSSGTAWSTPCSAGLAVGPSRRDMPRSFSPPDRLA